MASGRTIKGFWGEFWAPPLPPPPPRANDEQATVNLVSLCLALAMIRDLRAALEPFANAPIADPKVTRLDLMRAREVYARTGAAAK